MVIENLRGHPVFYKRIQVDKRQVKISWIGGIYFRLSHFSKSWLIITNVTFIVVIKQNWVKPFGNQKIKLFNNEKVVAELAVPQTVFPKNFRSQEFAIAFRNIPHFHRIKRDGVQYFDTIILIGYI